MVRWVGVAWAMFFFSGCHFTTLTIRKDKVATVKRVAIVGFDGELKLDDGDTKNVITANIAASKNMADVKSGRRAQRRFEQAAVEYDHLAKLLSEGLGWEVVDRAVVAQSPTLRRFAVGDGLSFNRGHQFLPELSNQALLNGAGDAARKQIAQELGVDAIVACDVAFINGGTGGVSVGGFGSTTMHPYGQAHFKVLDQNGEIIWEDFWAVGDKTQEGIRTTMGAMVVENETKVLAQAAASAFQELLRRYRTYQPPPEKR